MNTPIMFALIALISEGIAKFYSKVAAENQVYSPSWILVVALWLALFSGVLHIVQRHPFELTVKMSVVAMLPGILGGIGFYALLLAFRSGGQGSVIFPIAGLGVIVAVPLSFIVFGEPMTTTRLLGLGLGIASIVILSR